MRPRRVLQLITELHPAGAERVVYELATRLSPERWQVQVAGLRSPGGDEGAVARALRAAGIEVHPLGFRHKADLRAAARLLRLVRRWRPHLVHAHLFHANLAARLLALLGAQRTVSTVHVVERRRLPQRILLERLGARLDDATVCVSEAVARYALSSLGVRPERLRVVPNGVDLSAYAALPDREAARSALRLDPACEWVGCVGRLDRQKGQDLLLEAFARFRARRPRARLLLCGAGPEEGALRAQARRLGIEERVRFLGHRDDVPLVLAALDVFCLPSRWEGFGLALVEALAAGRACVASAVDSLPEVLGGAGRIVSPEDPRALAAALEALLADPRERAALGQRARARARRYSVERMVAGYELLYADLFGDAVDRSPPA
ncbi:MAG: glycosyltransferase [Planctomycetota bacterium]|nr:MAG: glycosyltransferase [Planctomycetota bacterium]